MSRDYFRYFIRNLNPKKVQINYLSIHKPKSILLNNSFLY